MRKSAELAVRNREMVVTQKKKSNLLFDGVASDEVEAITASLPCRRYASGEIICHEGDRGELLYLIEGGAVAISKRGRGDRQETLKVLYPGEFFGEVALVDGQPRTARATAEGNSMLREIDRSGLYELFTTHPQTAFNFLRHVAQRLRHADEHFIQELLLAERMSVLGSMVGSIVHDFKNPMGILVMVADYLEGCQGDDPALQQLASSSRKAVDAMVDMMNELLDFSRGRVEIRRQAVSATQLEAALDDQILDHLKETGLEIVTRLEFDDHLDIDLNRFSRVIVNIVKNAAEAMPDEATGKITVHARTLPDSADEIEFRIADNGAGIPEDVQPRIFEPFVTHGKKDGTGLGMAIAKSVVEAHGGKIHFESELERGTTFFLRIPTSEPEA